MDYKQALALTERGTLTASAKKDLARDVSALANAEGGLLVIGVKDPEREGAAPSPEDFVGVAVPETFGRDLESVLLGTVSPPLYPMVRVTEDDFEDPETGESRRFVLVGARRGSRLHQVTAGGEYRFYRRAGYQNRPMDESEVRLRISAEATAEAETRRLINAEAERIGRVFEDGPRVAFLAVPTVAHRFPVKPASLETLNELSMYAWRQPPRNAPAGVEILSPGFDSSRAFVPAGDGARSFYRIPNVPVTAEVRVRRDGLVSSARDHVEMYNEPGQRLCLRKPNPWDEVFVPVPETELGTGLVEAARAWAAEGYPSTVAGLTPAVRLDPPMLMASARGFLRFVGEAYRYLGYPGPIHVEALVSGGDSYVAAAAPQMGAEPRFYFVSEHTSCVPRSRRSSKISRAARPVSPRRSSSSWRGTSGSIPWNGNRLGAPLLGSRITDLLRALRADLPARWPVALFRAYLGCTPLRGCLPGPRVTPPGGIPRTLAA